MKKISTFLFSVSVVVNLYSQTSIEDSIFFDGMYRNYILFVPAAYDGSQPVPLVLNLHGYGSNAYEQFFYADFKPVADTANFLVVHPDGTKDGFGLQFWNCFGPDDTGVDDVQFLSDLIDTISAAYNVNANRIYSTGMSNGGFMSYTLAGELSNRIAAIASVTGSIDVERFPAINPQHPTPVMEIHGNADFVVPYDGNSDFMAIESVIDYWVVSNNCSPTPEILEVENISTTDGCTAEHYIYSGGDNNANVELFKILGGGHTWPGTVFTYFGVTNLDINACKEIWNFFNRYSLDVLTDHEEISAQEENIHVFPNPCNHSLALSHAADEIKIYNMMGKQIAHEFESTLLNTSEWPQGTYLMQVKKGEIISTHMIQKIAE